MPIAVLVLDPQHKVQFCNEAFEKLFQYSESELVAEDLQEMIATNELAPEAIEIWRRVVTGESVYAATQRRRKDGNVVDVELHGIPIMAGGVLVGVFAYWKGFNPVAIFWTLTGFWVYFAVPVAWMQTPTTVVLVGAGYLLSMHLLIPRMTFFEATNDI